MSDAVGDVAELIERLRNFEMANHSLHEDLSELLIEAASRLAALQQERDDYRTKGAAHIRLLAVNNDNLRAEIAALQQRMKELEAREKPLWPSRIYAGANQPENIMSDDQIEPIIQFFDYSHLPEHLQDVSRPFSQLAAVIMSTLPRNPERTVALRKLLEAKDAAVRARLFK